MARIKMVEMEARKLRIMRYIASHSHPSKPALVSRKTIMRDLELTTGQLRCSVGRLADQGYVQVLPRYLQSGCQVENAYAITLAGWAYLQADDSHA